jgi:hypothetical protein
MCTCSEFFCCLTFATVVETLVIACALYIGKRKKSVEADTAMFRLGHFRIPG